MPDTALSPRFPTVTVTTLGSFSGMPQKDVFPCTTTLRAPPSSGMEPGWRNSLTPKYVAALAPSLPAPSVSVRVAPVTVMPAALPETPIVSSPSWLLSSSFGVSVNVPVAVVAFAGIVTVKSETAT